MLFLQPCFCKDSREAQVRFRRLRQERNDDTTFRFHQRKTQLVSSLTLKSRSHLVTFLVVICQYAIFDTVNLLPIGIIMYAAGISLAVEEMVHGRSLFWYEDTFFSETQLMRQELQSEIKLAEFEYHILKGMPRTKIIPVNENGRLVLYAA